MLDAVDSGSESTCGGLDAIEVCKSMTDENYYMSSERGKRCWKS